MVDGPDAMNPVKKIKPCYCTIVIAAVLVVCGADAFGDGRLPRWGYIVGSDTRHNDNPDYIQRIARQYDMVAVTGCAIDERGGVRCPWRTEKKLKMFASMGVETSMVATFTSVRAGERLLRSPELRRAAARALYDTAVALRARDIHCDFEYLAPSYAADLALFFRELRSLTRRNRGSPAISMAVFPAIDFPGEWSGFHDLAKLSPFLDRVVLMCYDYHRKDTQPGPVTDVAWVERNVEDALTHVSPERLWLGVPAYGYAWNANGGVMAVSSRYAVRQAKKHGAQRHRSGTLYYEYGSGADTVRVFAADAETRKMLEGTARKHRLRGTALWRIGLEE